MASFVAGQHVIVPGVPVFGIEYYFHHGIVSHVDNDGAVWVIHYQRFLVKQILKFKKLPLSSLRAHLGGVKYKLLEATLVCNNLR